MFGLRPETLDEFRYLNKLMASRPVAQFSLAEGFAANPSAFFYGGKMPPLRVEGILPPCLQTARRSLFLHLRIQHRFANDLFGRRGAVVHERDAAVSQQPHPFLFGSVSQFISGPVLNNHRTQFIIHDH